MFLLIMIKKCSVIYWGNQPCYVIILPRFWCEVVYWFSRFIIISANFWSVGKRSATYALWKSVANTANDLSSPSERKNDNLRKLSLYQECLVTMMCLQAGLMIDDLTFRSDVSNMNKFSVFTTWLKFMAK